MASLGINCEKMFFTWFVCSVGLLVFVILANEFIISCSNEDSAFINLETAKQVSFI